MIRTLTLIGRLSNAARAVLKEQEPSPYQDIKDDLQALKGMIANKEPVQRSLYEQKIAFLEKLIKKKEKLRGL